jgi:glycosyltransferase involved in cell wall biosynthesis
VRIALIQHTYNPTTVGWVQGLEERGHDVIVMVSSLREPLGGCDHGRVVVVPDLPWSVRLGRRLLPGRAKAVVAIPSPVQMWRELRRQRVDVVLIKVYSLRNVLASIVALLLGCRRVSWFEQVPPVGPEWRVLARLGILPRRQFTALADRPGGLERSSSAGLTHIPYAPMRAATVAPRDPVGRPLRVLTVAAFTNPVKRPIWTLRAAAVAGLLPDGVRLTFCGLGGPNRMDEELLALDRDLGARSRILVNVAYRDMTALYDEHDVLVLPSSADQFGMVIPEAMARGMAVVTSDVVGAIGFVRHGETGLVFDANDLGDLAAQLARLAAEPGLVDRLGVAAQRFIAEHASPALTAERIERFALSRSRARAGTPTRR